MSKQSTKPKIYGTASEERSSLASADSWKEKTNAPKEAYPLTWPDGWPKPARRSRSAFGERSIATARDMMIHQLSLNGVRDFNVVISSNLSLRRDGLPYGNQPQPEDPSIAVYFRLNDKPYVLACGKWDRVQDNLWATAKHIEALRGQQRWGVGSIEQAFRGYTALPEKSGGLSWWDTLGVAMNASEEQITAAYRTKAKILHPDVGGDAAAMAKLNEAYRMATSQKQG